MDVSKTLSASITLKFENCDIFMGQGSVIYCWFIEFENCNVQGRCGMWEGINPSNHGKIKALNSQFSDAEFCMTIFDVEATIQLKNVDFYRNFVSIYAPAKSSANSFGYNITPAVNSYIEYTRFDGSNPITLPPYIGQWGIPKAQKSFSGMYLNNLRRPFLGGSAFDRVFMIPFSRDENFTTEFADLHYGIYAVNSDIEVYNCIFERMQEVTAYRGRNYRYGGCAILSRCTPGSGPRFLHVGDDHDNENALEYKNHFWDCRFGVVTENSVNSYVAFNEFSATGNLTGPSGTGIYLKDADNRQITIKNNQFTEQNPNIYGIYSSTAIAISSITQTRKILNISNNDFHNQKVGIYLQNCKGRRPSDLSFLVEDNTFVCDLDALDFPRYQNNIIGLWLNNTANGLIRFNQFYRPVPLASQPGNFKNLVFGMNVVGSTDLTIASNDFTQYGTSIRMVSLCSGTMLKCNNMFANVQGIRLDVASLTPQGKPGEAWDNKWDEFPVSSSPYNRSDGTVTAPVNWFNRGQANSTNAPNVYSPEPADPSVIWPVPNQPSPGCYLPNPFVDLGGRNHRIAKIVSGDIEYLIFPEETRYLDKEFAYYALLEDTVLLNSNPDYGEYIDSLNAIEFGVFEEADELYQNGELLDALSALGLKPEGSLIEQYKYRTREIFMNQKYNDDDRLVEEEIEELGTIAWTNAWVGGSGVFGARHLLEEQVFDLENNLRIGRAIKDKNEAVIPMNVSLYPNPARESVTLFYDVNPKDVLEINILDLSGRLVYRETMKSNKLDINSLNNGIYLLQIFINQQLNTVTKLTVLK
ncbi:MAG: T9SS type A sorting domain-containing protein [Bacteroidetes bacterium]|nr:MAG: T9SS type A sorting domain-containing protein [Bacteroidota bacterium]